MALSNGVQHKKDVFSLDELASLNSMLDSTNEFLVGWEEDDNLVITDFSFNVSDKNGVHVGAITKFNTDEVQYEPDFKAGI